MIKLIATMSVDNVICNELGEIPWIIEADMDRLSSLTRDDIVLMGRKTFESLGSVPMLNRETAVITRRITNPRIKNVHYFKNTQEAIKFYKNRTIWVIGGASIFADTIGIANEMYITTVLNKKAIYGKEFPKIGEDWGTGKMVSMGSEPVNYIQAKYVKNIS